MSEIPRYMMRRILAREAEGKLKALLELYADDEVDGPRIQNENDYKKMNAKIEEFLEWLWEESPIA